MPLRDSGSGNGAERRGGECLQCARAPLSAPDSPMPTQPLHSAVAEVRGKGLWLLPDAEALQLPPNRAPGSQGNGKVVAPGGKPAILDWRWDGICVRDVRSGQVGVRLEARP